MVSRLIVTKKTIGEENKYIGKEGQIFWNTDEKLLRRSDGETEGGVPIILEGGFLPTQFINYFDFESNSVTTFESINQWKKIESDTVNLFSSGNDFIHTNNRVTNTNGDIIVKMEGIGSIKCAQGSTEIHMAFFKNGILIPCSEQSGYTVTHGQNSFSSAVPFQCIFNLSEGDFLEVYVKNTTNTTSITLINLNVIITRYI